MILIPIVLVHNGRRPLGVNPHPSTYMYDTLANRFTQVITININYKLS